MQLWIVFFDACIFGASSVALSLVLRLALVSLSFRFLFIVLFSVTGDSTTRLLHSNFFRSLVYSLLVL